MSSGDFFVSYDETRGANTRWVVRRHGNIESTHSTQQYAIEAAKGRARGMLVDVVWQDRNGNKQGHARYRVGIL